MRGVGLDKTGALEWPLTSPLELRDLSYPRGQSEAVLEYAVTFVSIDIRQPIVLRWYEARIQFIKLRQRVLEVGHGRASQLGSAIATVVGVVLALLGRCNQVRAVGHRLLCGISGAGQRS